MPAGAPPKYTSVKELESKIDEYFKNLPTRKVIFKDSEMEIPVATITGLALHLGFASRQSFYDYEGTDKFSYVIKRARLKIEHEYEKHLSTNNSPTGAIFALKNMNWSDKQETEHYGKDGGSIGLDLIWNVKVVD